jgi:putative effector of murein hydrolase
VKTITLLAVAVILLADVFGSKSSVGGPMTDLLVSFIVMLAVGLYEAWGRGPFGWIANVVLAVIGGLVALSLMSMALETAMTAIHFQGKLATSDHPLRYIADVAMPISAVLGSWIAIKIVHWVISGIAAMLAHKPNVSSGL